MQENRYLKDKEGNQHYVSSQLLEVYSVLAREEEVKGALKSSGSTIDFFLSAIKNGWFPDNSSLPYYPLRMEMLHLIFTLEIDTTLSPFNGSVWVTPIDAIGLPEMDVYSLIAAYYIFADNTTYSGFANLVRNVHLDYFNRIMTKFLIEIANVGSVVDVEKTLESLSISGSKADFIRLIDNTDTVHYIDRYILMLTSNINIDDTRVDIDFTTMVLIVEMIYLVYRGIKWYRYDSTVYLDNYAGIKFGIQQLGLYSKNYQAIEFLKAHP